VSAAAKARVVFDTNVVLSALLFTHGRLNWLVGHWQGRNCVPLLSRASAAELARILVYSKFRLTAIEQLEALSEYVPYCKEVEVVQSCPILCRDAKDQPLLDLAQSAKADLLVTGDDDLLALTGQTEFLIETQEAYRQRVFAAEINL
jgi:putative PIN family toxin of toxin-antitoxin system